MTETSPIPPAAGNRFLSPWPAREALGVAAIVALVLSCVFLSRPVATILFSPDGETLETGVVAALESVRLVAGLLGLLLLAMSCAPRLEGRRLPLSRGAAVLGAGAAIAAFLLGEGLLRCKGHRDWGSAARTPLPISSMRPEGEVLLRPGVYVSGLEDHFRPGLRRTLHFTIQRFGVRGEAPRNASAGEGARIICVGGSTTLGYTVTDGEEWPAVLGQLLRRSGPVEVINAGRPGATTWSNYRLLRDRLLPLDPDVVIFYEGFNDMWRGVRRHAAVQEDYGPVDVGVPPTSAPFDLGPPREWPLRPSFITFWAGRALAARLDARPPRPVPPAESLFDPAIVGLYEANLAAMVRLCREHGALPIVATFAGCDRAGLPAEEARRRLRYVREQIPPLSGELALEGLELYREKTRQVAGRENAPLVDLAALVPRETVLFTDTVHFTPEGERTVAELLAAALRSEARVALGGHASPDDPQSDH